MTRAALTLLALVLVAGRADAATATELAIAEAVRARLPAELALVSVEVPATTPAQGPVEIVWRGVSLRAGKVSVMVSVAGRRFWARVQLAQLADPPPPTPATSEVQVPRGAIVKVLVRRGHVEISAEGQLEWAARIGEPVTVRLTSGARLVHGTLASAGLVLIGDAP